MVSCNALEDILTYQKLLKEFNITFTELADLCLELHFCQTIKEAARIVAETQVLREYLINHRDLDLVICSKHYPGFHTLILYKKYIIAIALIYIHDLPNLQSFILDLQKSR